MNRLCTPLKNVGLMLVVCCLLNSCGLRQGYVGQPTAYVSEDGRSYWRLALDPTGCFELHHLAADTAAYMQGRFTAQGKHYLLRAAQPAGGIDTICFRVVANEKPGVTVRVLSDYFTHRPQRGVFFRALNADGVSWGGGVTDSLGVLWLGLPKKMVIESSDTNSKIILLDSNSIKTFKRAGYHIQDFTKVEDGVPKKYYVALPLQWPAHRTPEPDDAELVNKLEMETSKGVRTIPLNISANKHVQVLVYHHPHASPVTAGTYKVTIRPYKGTSYRIGWQGSNRIASRSLAQRPAPCRQ